MSDRLGIMGKVLMDAKAEGRTALISYLPVGYPSVEGSLEAMRVVSEHADIIEIGMPYSDPMMDGVAIQYATTKALELGVRTTDIFKATEAVRAAGKTPAVMIYWNLVEHYGVDAFARDLANAGGAGLITPDLIPDEADEWIEASDKYGLDRIFLIAPSSTDERIAMTMDACRGWVYATSVMGVTGTRSETSSAAPVIVERARKIRSDLPVCVGLGISNGQQAHETGQYADAAIVGSALVKCMIEAEGTDQQLGRLAEVAEDLGRGVRN